MGWPPPGKNFSDYENARSRVSYVHQRRPFQCCTNPTCNGWEWVSNQKTHCRVPGCNSVLHKPPLRSSSRQPRPRKAPREKSADSLGKSSKSSELEELVPLLQANLPQLQAQFPALAKSLQNFEVPTAAPAAVLHGAQSACQVAFKELQHAETDVAQLELDINETLAEVREKVQILSEKQESLVQLRAKYDEAAKTAQLEVQRTRTNGYVESETEHVCKLVQQYSPDQLEVMAASLTKAAQEARDAKTAAASTPKPSPTSSPKLQPSHQPQDADMAAATESQTKLDDEVAARLLAEPPVANATAPESMAHATSPASLGVASDVVFGPALPSVVEGSPSPPSPTRRETSRSPRRGTSVPKNDEASSASKEKKDNARETSPSQEPPPKNGKAIDGEDVHDARARSVSVKSGASVASSQPAEHYAEVLAQVATDVAAAKSKAKKAVQP